jgi:hypothetical protein
MNEYNDIERVLADLTWDVPAEVDANVLEDGCEALGAHAGPPALEPQKASRNGSLNKTSKLTWPSHRGIGFKEITRISYWRTLMSNRLTKFAAVAAVAAVVVLGLTFFPGKNSNAGRAWAIEQSIAAMRATHSMHALCTDWDGSQVELWVQVDPESGQEKYYRAEQGTVLIVGTPEATYYYHKDKNLVRVHKGYVPAAEVRFSRFFEDIAAWVQKYKGELSFSSQYDEGLKREVTNVRVAIPAQGDIGEKEMVIRVDSETRLPISLQQLKYTEGEGLKSVDRLEYNTAIPAGSFEFKIPQGAKVVEE